MNNNISRRSFLQWFSTLSSAVFLPWKGKKGFTAEKNSILEEIENELIFDNEMKVLAGAHPHNCGGRCTFKFFVKNNRLVKCTSAGDIERKNSKEHDESIDMVQHRACPRGYAQIKRTYAPDRLKYPLLQTKERGDFTGFKRISWDEAIDKATSWIKEAQNRYISQELPYVPIATAYGNALNSGMEFGGMVIGGFAAGTGSSIVKYLGPYIMPTGAPSTENLTYALHATLGSSAQGNSINDYLNTKFLLNWGQDNPVKYPNGTFFLTKAKEAGIPIVTVDVYFTDSAAQLSTGFREFGLPPFIQVRPQTDSAILVAMADYIYRNNLHDEAFLKEYTFGFFPNDKVMNPNFKEGDISNNKEFVTPKGWSFIEYLDQVERELSKSSSFVGKSNGLNAVLDWASGLSGVPKKYIISLAEAYGKTKPAKLDAGNAGGQKTNNGMHHCWLLICLTAMTGNTNKIGGGNGVDAAATTFPLFISFPNLGEGLKSYPVIPISANGFAKTALTGTDWREDKQIIDDTIKATNGAVQLTDRNGKLIEIDMVIGGYNGSNSFNTCPNTNKAVYAFTRKKQSGDYLIKHYLMYEQFMTPSAVYADLIFPAASHHEQYFITFGLFPGAGVWLFNNKLFDPLFDTKTDIEIDELIAQRLGINWGLKGKSMLDILKENYEKAPLLDSSFTKPSFEEFIKKGVIQVPRPASSAQVGTMKPGQAFDPATGAFRAATDTGRLNFFSPYYYNRDGAGKYRVIPRAAYVRPKEGYEDILDGKIGHKGIKYTLQFTTKHARNRAHTVYDNVPMLRDNYDYPKRAAMHPDDAQKRDIKDGDTVYIFNDWGCIKVGVELSVRVRPGCVLLPHGVWYRPSSTETYLAYFDINGDDIPETIRVPVDIGGCENVLTHDYDNGPKDGLLPVSDNHFNGNLCEVSKIHPDSL
jgi:anaerobic dimethyl sulfoxide reductase subunit A